MILKDPLGSWALVFRNKRLRNLISHSQRTVSFYHKYRGKAFEKLQLISKKVIRDNFTILSRPTTLIPHFIKYLQVAAPG